MERFKRNKDKLVAKLKKFMKYVISKPAVNLYSIESKQIYDLLNDDYYFKDRLELIPNGFSCDAEEELDINQKENIILTVGRLGTEQKYNELLIDAVSMIDQSLIGDWKVYLVGPIIDNKIQRYVEDAVRKKPYLNDTFIFTGNINDKSKLYDIYRKAKIFCLTSRWEGFALVLPESMYFSNYIISSDLPSTRDLTQDGEIGALYPIGDLLKLSELITNAISGQIDLTKITKQSQKFVMENYNWNNIGKKIDSLLSCKD